MIDSAARRQAEEALAKLIIDATALRRGRSRLLANHPRLSDLDVTGLPRGDSRCFRCGP